MVLVQQNSFFVIFVLQNFFDASTTESKTKDSELYKYRVDVPECNADQKRGYLGRFVPTSFRVAQTRELDIMLETFV